MIDRAEPLAGLSFEAWSRLCSDRMRHRQNYTQGDSTLARDHIARITQGRCRFSVRGRSEGACFGGAVARIGRVSLQFLTWDWDGECETRTLRHPEQHVVLYLVLKGSFEAFQEGATALVRAGDLLVASSAGQLVRRWSGPCELLNIVISRDLFSRMLAVEFGIDADSPLLFERLAIIKRERAATLLGFVELLLRDQEQAAPTFAGSALARQAERLLMHLVLAVAPHNYGQAVRDHQNDIVPYYVRRADEYIAEHIGETVTIEALVNAAGVSPRTLYYGYRKYRGMSPMTYIRTKRLHLCRAALTAANPRALKVAEIAAQFGYANPSQFSRDYKNHFGTSPVQTLRRMELG